MKKSLDALGLKLEPDTETMRMMVVGRAGGRAGHQ
jgi:hypothetical protein